MTSPSRSGKRRRLEGGAAYSPYWCGALTWRCEHLLGQAVQRGRGACVATARLPGGGSSIRGWRVDIYGSSAYTDGDDAGKGAGTNGKEASRGQEKHAKGLRRRLQERAEPGAGERPAVALCVHVRPLRPPSRQGPGAQEQPTVFGLSTRHIWTSRATIRFSIAARLMIRSAYSVPAVTRNAAVIGSLHA